MIRTGKIMRWVPKLGVLALCISGCVLGAPEDGSALNDPSSIEDFRHDYTMPNGNLDSPNTGSEQDDPNDYDGKSDDGQRSSPKQGTNSSAYDDPSDPANCPNAEEFEADELPDGECAPDERGVDHGSPQPLDPDDDESDSDEDDES
jgi:hypothetical protein